uniref:Milk fat globule-EGF factor 8 protein b n=1 Tax=Hucho hucho TaxID=62062 RepID=A0A4W5L5A6_9TELE
MSVPYGYVLSLLCPPHHNSGRYWLSSSMCFQCAVHRVAGLGLSCPSLVYHTSLSLFSSRCLSSHFTVYSNTAGCSEPLGMKSRLLADRQFSASSVYRTWGIEAFTWQPHYARLDKQGKTNAWTADTTKRSEWLQVTAGGSEGILGSDILEVIALGHQQGVTSVFIFPGNSDNNVHKKNLFEPPFYARFVRVLPWAWHGRITLRMELLGCDE